MVFPIFSSPYMTAEEQAAFYLKRIREVAEYGSPWEGLVVKANGDEQLLREALEALEPLARCAEDSPPNSPDHRVLYDGAFVGIVLGDARRARAAITKLEERLLSE